MKNTNNKNNLFNETMLKTTVILIMVILYSNIVHAQLLQYIANQDNTQTLYDIKAGMDVYMDSLAAVEDSATFYAEGGEYIEYRKFMHYWEPILLPDGDFNRVFNADSAYFLNNQTNYQYFTDQPWHEIGPFDRPGGTSDGVGPVEYLSIFDSGTVESTKYMLVASLLGGVFYSTDYGETWNSTATDTQWALSGSGCAIFSPDDHTTWFASSSGNSNNGSSLWIGKTGGIYRTTDEGLNYTIIADRADLGGQWTKIFKLIIVPGTPQKLFAITSDGIFKSEDFNAPNTNPTWTKVWNGLSYDMEIKPDNNQIVYATTYIPDESKWKVIKSTNSGNTWNELSQQPQLVESNNYGKNSYTIEVSKAKPDYLYCLVDDDWYANVYYADFSTSNSWNKVNQTPYKMSFGSGHSFGVDQASTGEKLMTSYWIKMKLFDITNPSNGTNKNQHHSDVEDILYHPYNQDEIWLCTHGGVEKSTDGGSTWQTKYHGLAVANVEEMATSVTNPELIMVGLYHDHTQITRTPYGENWIPDWDEAYQYGDGMRPLINPIDPNYMWASSQTGSWKHSNDKFTNNSQGRSLLTDFYTEGVLNKTDPSKMYRHAYISNTDKNEEVYSSNSSGDTRVSSFSNLIPDKYYIWGLYTPYTNGDYLVITIVNNITGSCKLFRTTNINDSPANIQWTELTIPRNDAWISSLDFDPYNEDIVYIVYGNSSTEGDYGTEMVYKIDYSNTSSPVFSNLSANLPNTTAKKDCIKVDNGSTRGIYLYTSYGIFYTNNDLLANNNEPWQKYGVNLPHTRGGSLEINYVSHKLRAGLFGRGVWEINLPCITDVDDVDVNNNETWQNNTRVAGTVTIEPQKELTILNSTISFGTGAKIIVKPGAKLILDGATLTNACSGPWQGIQVWGDKNHTQYPDANGNYYQGYLELKNDAVIENAVCAVDLWKPDDWSSTGGVVYADGATFRNNAKSVHALYYENFNPYYPTQELPYSSNFKNCTFEITEDYPGTETFYKHVDLSHVKGIDFQHCDFSLEPDVAGVSTWNNAIAGYDAQFRVSALCNSQVAPCPEEDLEKCTFTGFYRAISALNDGGSPVTFYVNNTDFINNAYGVKTRSMNNATILFSNFEIGQLYGCGAGINSDNVTGFAFEENNFSKYTGGPQANYFGIIINNSHAVNEVYKNNFTGLSYANFADGKNWINDDRYHGLAYYCNQNSNNYADFYVNETKPSGIQSIQGSDTYPAGNTFTQNGATWHFYNGGEHLVQYFYNQNNSIEIPDYPDKVHNVAITPVNDENTCPSHYGNDIKVVLNDAQKANAEQTYYNNLSDYNNIKTLYDSYIDGGSTTDEKLDIETAQPDDMWALRAQLLGDSPHLSFDALKEAADKTDVFTESALFDILAANPDELRKDTLISYLENKEQPLPDYMIDLLKQLAEGTTYKTALQEQLSEYKHDYTRAALDIVRSILNDTLTNDTLLRNWLDNLGDINYDRQIIASYVNEGNFTDAFSLANMLPQFYDLDSVELVEHNYYIDLLTLYDTLYSQGRNTYQMDSTEKALVEYITTNSTDVAGSYAKSILEAVDDEYYPDCPDITETASYKQGSVINSETLGKIYGLDISVKPNPAKQWAAFDYTLPEKETIGTIIITNSSGVVVKTLQVSGHQGQKLLDTRKLPSGMYLYSIKTGRYTKTGKMVILK